MASSSSSVPPRALSFLRELDPSLRWKINQLLISQGTSSLQGAVSVVTDPMKGKKMGRKFFLFGDPVEESSFLSTSETSFQVNAAGGNLEKGFLGTVQQGLFVLAKDLPRGFRGLEVQVSLLDVGIPMKEDPFFEDMIEEEEDVKIIEERKPDGSISSKRLLPLGSVQTDLGTFTKVKPPLLLTAEKISKADVLSNLQLLGENGINVAKSLRNLLQSSSWEGDHWNFFYVPLPVAKHGSRESEKYTQWEISLDVLTLDSRNVATTILVPVTQEQIITDLRDTSESTTPSFFLFHAMIQEESLSTDEM